MTDDVTTRGGVGVNVPDFECLIFISVHATFDHAICMTLVLERGGDRVRMTKKEPERGGEVKSRGERGEVSVGKWQKQ